VNHLRDNWPIDEYCADIKVKSIFCFVIAPKMQRMGVATKLIERICQDAAADNFDFVEAYTNVNFTDVPNEFRGPLSMYEKCGFSKTAERDGRVVVRKALK
jgi:GNAT superfamily N-acetyltransferase